MTKQVKLRLVTVATAAALLLAVVVAIIAIGMLSFGTPMTVVSEIPLSAVVQGVPQPTTIEYAPYPAASIPLLGAALLIIALLTHKLSLAWAAVAILAAFSALFLFSLGGLLLPVVGLLLIFLIIIQRNDQRTSRIKSPPPI